MARRNYVMYDLQADTGSFDSSQLEEYLFGAVINNPDKYFELAEKHGISADWFQAKSHRDAWCFLKERFQQGEELNPALLHANHQKTVESVGGLTALTGWALKNCPDEHYFHHNIAKGIVDKHTKRTALGELDNIREALVSGETISGCQTLFEKAILANQNSLVGPMSDLIARAYELNFNADDVPPEDESCMFIGDNHAIAARGNLTGIQGKQKVGKSAVVSAILGAAIRGNYAAQGDVFQFNWHGDSSGAIIHFDTEQSPCDWHGSVSRAKRRSGLSIDENRLFSIPAVTFTRSERMGILEGVLKRESDRLGRIDTVLIDGIADLAKAPNDETESLELISKIHSLSHTYDCPIFVVLHENPGSENGKTRGHLGSELSRKAFANIRVDKDSETLVSTIYGTDMRKAELPKGLGFCFAYDNDSGMHTYKGRHANCKTLERDEKRAIKAREQLEPIYDKAAEVGTFGIVPTLSPEEAVELERDIIETGKPTTLGAMKKRLQRAEELGVTRNMGNSRWKYIYPGTIGT